MQVQRPVIKQEGDSFSFTATASAAPLMPQSTLAALIDSFTITIPQGAANSVFLGFNQGVTVATGLELIAGTTTAFKIDHDTRQLYEIQQLLMKINQALCGAPVTPTEAIPFVAWDMSQVFVVAAANTAMSFAIFKAVYI